MRVCISVNLGSVCIIAATIMSPGGTSVSYQFVTLLRSSHRMLLVYHRIIILLLLITHTCHDRDHHLIHHTHFPSHLHPLHHLLTVVENLMENYPVSYYYRNVKIGFGFLIKCMACSSILLSQYSFNCTIN